MHTNIENVSKVKLTAGEHTCVVDEDVWGSAVNVLNMISEYTQCVDVRKISTINMLHNHVGCTIHEARIMAEAYFAPRFRPYEGQDEYTEQPQRGWYQYRQATR